MVYGMEEQEKAYAHWLYQAVGIGHRGFLRALCQAASPREIHQMAVAKTLEKKLSERCQGKAAQLVEAAKGFDVIGEYERMRARGIFFVTNREEQFPARLLKIPDPPLALYYAGRLPPVWQKAVAVIGARSCSEYGKYMAQAFGESLAQAGVQVVSGMARGIDGKGQEAALQAGGYSIGVLGCGVDVCYPEENRSLYEALLERGGVCSEYPPGVGPRPILFPPRNRIISGLADALLVIEARERSGTLITVDMALEQGREVYAVPGRGTDPLSRGCNSLIRQGAALVSTPEELLRELSCALGQEREGRQRELLFLPGEQGDILQLIDLNPQSAEMLQCKYEQAYGKTMSFPQLFHELLQLCAGGHVQQVGGSYFVRKMK